MDVLKDKVKVMLMESAKELTENIEFINLLCRFGVSYHFENEIDEQLNNIFTSLSKNLEDCNFDLYTVALLFRVLRQHGYKLSCGKY